MTMSVDGQVLSGELNDSAILPKESYAVIAASDDVDGDSLILGSAISPSLRVIVCEGGKVNPGWKVFSDFTSMLILCTNRKIPDRTARRLPSYVQILQFPNKEIPIDSLLGLLRSFWGVKTLFHECGGSPDLLKKLLSADALDELQVKLSPVLGGSNIFMTPDGLTGGFLPKDRRFQLLSVKEVSDSIHLRYRLSAGSAKARRA